MYSKTVLLPYFLSRKEANPLFRVCQLNCVMLPCLELLGDNPERLFLGAAKVRI